jgi:hypothetical protein
MWSLEDASRQPISERLLSRGKKHRSVFLREEGFEPGLEKSSSVRIYL